MNNFELSKTLFRCPQEKRRREKMNTHFADILEDFETETFQVTPRLTKQLPKILFYFDEKDCFCSFEKLRNSKKKELGTEENYYNERFCLLECSIIVLRAHIYLREAIRMTTNDYYNVLKAHFENLDYRIKHQDRVVEREITQLYRLLVIWASIELTSLSDFPLTRNMNMTINYFIDLLKPIGVYPMNFEETLDVNGILDHFAEIKEDPKNVRIYRLILNNYILEYEPKKETEVLELLETYSTHFGSEVETLQRFWERKPDKILFVIRKSLELLLNSHAILVHPMSDILEFIYHFFDANQQNFLGYIIRTFSNGDELISSLFQIFNLLCYYYLSKSNSISTPSVASSLLQSIKKTNRKEKNIDLELTTTLEIIRLLFYGKDNQTQKQIYQILKFSIDQTLFLKLICYFILKKFSIQTSISLFTSITQLFHSSFEHLDQIFPTISYDQETNYYQLSRTPFLTLIPIVIGDFFRIVFETNSNNNPIVDQVKISILEYFNVILDTHFVLVKWFFQYNRGGQSVDYLNRFLTLILNENTSIPVKISALSLLSTIWNKSIPSIIFRNDNNSDNNNNNDNSANEPKVWKTIIDFLQLLKQNIEKAMKNDESQFNLPEYQELISKYHSVFLRILTTELFQSYLQNQQEDSELILQGIFTLDQLILVDINDSMISFLKVYTIYLKSKKFSKDDPRSKEHLNFLFSIFQRIYTFFDINLLTRSNTQSPSSPSYLQTLRHYHQYNNNLINGNNNENFKGNPLISILSENPEMKLQLFETIYMILINVNASYYYDLIDILAHYILLPKFSSICTRILRVISDYFNPKLNANLNQADPRLKIAEEKIERNRLVSQVSKLLFNCLTTNISSDNNNNNNINNINNNSNLNSMNIVSNIPNIGAQLTGNFARTEELEVIIDCLLSLSYHFNKYLDYRKANEILSNFCNYSHVIFEESSNYFLVNYYANTSNNPNDNTSNIKQTTDSNLYSNSHRNEMHRIYCKFFMIFSNLISSLIQQKFKAIENDELNQQSIGNDELILPIVILIQKYKTRLVAPFEHVHKRVYISSPLLEELHAIMMFYIHIAMIYNDNLDISDDNDDLDDDQMNVEPTHRYSRNNESFLQHLYHIYITYFPSFRYLINSLNNMQNESDKRFILLIISHFEKIYQFLSVDVLNSQEERRNVSEIFNQFSRISADRLYDYVDFSISRFHKISKEDERVLVSNSIMIAIGIISKFDAENFAAWKTYALKRLDNQSSGPTKTFFGKIKSCIQQLN